MELLSLAKALLQAFAFILHLSQCFPSAIASHVVSEYPNKCLVRTLPSSYLKNFPLRRKAIL